MTVSWFRYVRHADVPEYEAAGWTYAADLGPTHGLWSVLMQWSRLGSPPGCETDEPDAAAADNERSRRGDDLRSGEGAEGGSQERGGNPAAIEPDRCERSDDLHPAAV